MSTRTSKQNNPVTTLVTVLQVVILFAITSLIFSSTTFSITRYISKEIVIVLISSMLLISIILFSDYYRSMKLFMLLSGFTLANIFVIIWRTI